MSGSVECFPRKHKVLGSHMALCMCVCVVANKAIGIGPSHSLLVLAFDEAKPGPRRLGWQRS